MGKFGVQGNSTNEQKTINAMSSSASSSSESSDEESKFGKNTTLTRTRITPENVVNTSSAGKTGSVNKQAKSSSSSSDQDSDETDIDRPAKLSTPANRVVNLRWKQQISESLGVETNSIKEDFQPSANLLEESLNVSHHKPDVKDIIKTEHVARDDVAPVPEFRRIDLEDIGGHYMREQGSEFSVPNDSTVWIVQVPHDVEVQDLLGQNMPHQLKGETTIIGSSEKPLHIREPLHVSQDGTLCCMFSNGTSGFSLQTIRYSSCLQITHPNTGMTVPPVSPGCPWKSSDTPPTAEELLGSIDEDNWSRKYEASDTSKKKKKKEKKKKSKDTSGTDHGMHSIKQKGVNEVENENGEVDAFQHRKKKDKRKKEDNEEISLNETFLKETLLNSCQLEIDVGKTHKESKKKRKSVTEEEDVNERENSLNALHYEDSRKNGLGNECIGRENKVKAKHKKHKKKHEGDESEKSSNETLVDKDDLFTNLKKEILSQQMNTSNEHSEKKKKKKRDRDGYENSSLYDNSRMSDEESNVHQKEIHSPNLKQEILSQQMSQLDEHEEKKKKKKKKRDRDDNKNSSMYDDSRIMSDEENNVHQKGNDSLNLKQEILSQQMSQLDEHDEVKKKKKDRDDNENSSLYDDSRIMSDEKNNMHQKINDSLNVKQEILSQQMSQLNGHEKKKKKKHKENNEKHIQTQDDSTAVSGETNMNQYDHILMNLKEEILSQQASQLNKHDSEKEKKKHKGKKEKNIQMQDDSNVNSDEVSDMSQNARVSMSLKQEILSQQLSQIHQLDEGGKKKSKKRSSGGIIQTQEKQISNEVNFGANIHQKNTKNKDIINGLAENAPPSLNIKEEILSQQVSKLTEYERSKSKKKKQKCTESNENSFTSEEDLRQTPDEVNIRNIINQAGQHEYVNTSQSHHKKNKNKEKQNASDVYTPNIILSPVDIKGEIESCESEDCLSQTSKKRKRSKNGLLSDTEGSSYDTDSEIRKKKQKKNELNDALTNVNKLINRKDGASYPGECSQEKKKKKSKVFDESGMFQVPELPTEKQKMTKHREEPSVSFASDVEVKEELQTDSELSQCSGSPGKKKKRKSTLEDTHSELTFMERLFITQKAPDDD